MARGLPLTIDALNESYIIEGQSGSVVLKTETNAAWNGTISFYASMDEFAASADWTSVNAFNYGTGQRARTDTLANAAQLWLIQSPAFIFIKVEITTYVSGACIVETNDAQMVQGVVDMYPLAAGAASLGGVVTQNALLQSGPSQLEVKWAAINAASSGDNTLVALVASKKIRVIGLTLIAASAVTVAFKSGAATTKIPAMSFAANGGMDTWRPQGYFVETAAGEALVMALGGAVQVSGSLCYIEVS